VQLTVHWEITRLEHALLLLNTLLSIKTTSLRAIFSLKIFPPLFQRILRLQTYLTAKSSGMISITMNGQELIQMRKIKLDHIMNLFSVSDNTIHLFSPSLSMKKQLTKMDRWRIRILTRQRFTKSSILSICCLRLVRTFSQSKFQKKRKLRFLNMLTFLSWTL